MNEPTFDDSANLCSSCNLRPVDELGWGVGCSNCMMKYPPSLLKSCMDEFDYLAITRGGQHYRYNSASIHGDWVHLQVSGHWSPAGLGTHGHSFERGVDIPLSEFVLFADAPDGS